MLLWLTAALLVITSEDKVSYKMFTFVLSMLTRAKNVYKWYPVSSKFLVSITDEFRRTYLLDWLVFSDLVGETCCNETFKIRIRKSDRGQAFWLSNE